jgi:hypothetical protein
MVFLRDVRTVLGMEVADRDREAAERDKRFSLLRVYSSSTLAEKSSNAYCNKTLAEL